MPPLHPGECTCRLTSGAGRRTSAERFIVRSRFALGSYRRVRSLQDLANRPAVSKEQVRQIDGRANEKLKSMA